MAKRISVKEKDGVIITDLKEVKYKPKGPSISTSGILSKQLRDLPIEERENFLNELGRKKKSAANDSKNGK